MATESLTRAPDVEVLAKLEFPIVTYEVSREKIREYVTAIGDRNPLHSDPVAAREAGCRDIIAPPTFAAVFTSMPFRRALTDPEWVARSTINPARLLHGEQRYDFAQPVCPGDRLLVQSIVERVEQKKGLTFVHVASRVTDDGGERVLDAAMTVVLRP